MPRKIKYRFGDEKFTSKDAVKRRAAGIFADYYGSDEVPPSAPEYRFAADLLLNHINAPEKIGVGISGIYVGLAPDHPTKCFWVRRIDGSNTDFGVPACLESPYQLNRSSLRDLVRPQVDAFKADRLAGRLTFTSDFSGHSFPAGEAVADHDPPFDHLITIFFETRSEDPRKELLTRSADASSKPVWIDQSLADAFFEYHRSAHLRLVHYRENLSEIKIIQNRTSGEKGAPS